MKPRRFHVPTTIIDLLLTIAGVVASAGAATAIRSYAGILGPPFWLAVAAVSALLTLFTAVAVIRQRGSSELRTFKEQIRDAYLRALWESPFNPERR